MPQYSAISQNCHFRQTFDQLFSELPKDVLELPSDPWSPYRTRVLDLFLAHQLTQTDYGVALALAVLHDQGIDTPSNEQVAQAVKPRPCCARSVRRATAKLVAFGLLEKHERYVMIDSQPMRRENRFQFLQPPDEPVLVKQRKRPEKRPPWPSGQTVRAVGKDENHGDSTGTVPLWKSAFRKDFAQPLLARQRQMEERLRQEYLDRPKTRPIRGPEQQAPPTG